MRHSSIYPDCQFAVKVEWFPNGSHLPELCWAASFEGHLPFSWPHPHLAWLTHGPTAAWLWNASVVTGERHHLRSPDLMLSCSTPSIWVECQHLLELRGQSTYHLKMSVWGWRLQPMNFLLHSWVPEQFSDLVSQRYGVESILIISPFMESQWNIWENNLNLWISEQIKKQKQKKPAARSVWFLGGPVECASCRRRLPPAGCLVPGKTSCRGSSSGGGGSLRLVQTYFLGGWHLRLG